MSEQSGASAQISTKRKSTILIVDDNAYGRDILKRLLITKGYRLVFASNGMEAIAKAGQVMPDLILLDVMMPGMDGFEVCRRLRADDKLREVPIIMLTALDEPHARMQGLEAGADDFITKPFDRDELRARVYTILRLNRYRRLLLERTKFEWVIDNANDGYLILDENDQIVYANPRAKLYLGLLGTDGPEREKFLKLARKQYLCKPAEAWSNWPHQPEDNLARYLVRPESVMAGAFWLQVDILNLAEEDEENTNQVICLRDITGHMALERDMRGFHEMIRHKLGTPLFRMLGDLELLAKHSSKMSNEDVTRFAETALQSARRLDSQIKDIMQYAQAATSKGNNDDALFPISNLTPVINHISENLQLSPVEILGLDEVSARHFRIAPRTLELILWEILENAKKFHPKDNPHVKIFVSLAGRRGLNLSIWDDGVHLSPEQLEQVWKPYYQGEKHFTGEVKGMGLGLSLVAMLVWSAGGKYNIKNRTDIPGVIVDLTLPLQRRKRATLPPKDEA